MEEWQEIYEFPGYSVSNRGRVINLDTGRILAMTRNRQGVYMVGLSRDNKQYKRGVGLLVADTFLPKPKDPNFNTPIHLDGDRANNDVDNLMWRPRWFAIDYARQFHENPLQFIVPIQELNSGEIFPSSWEAVLKFGLLSRDLVIATQNNTFVWPTFQRFRVVD